MLKIKLNCSMVAALMFCVAPIAALANETAFAPAGLNLKMASFDVAPTFPSELDLPPLKILDEAAEAFIIEEADVWGRIRRGFAIPNLESQAVTNQMSWFAARPDYFQRTSGRASRYLFHVVQELEKRGMPTELALLPFIESSFNPQAFSSAQAAGMWQFIPSTGRDFNLKQTMFKDERRGVLASTDAALSYLQKLYGMFGDWQLALAAYNWGEGSVLRAIKKNQAAGLPIDFNSLSPIMPQETRNYYPKLQAVKNIVANPAQYGINVPKVDNQPFFVSIGKTSDIDIKVAAQLAELPLDEFKALNPQFNRPVITGGAKTQILLPQENASKFKLNLSQWGRALSSWTTHTITSTRERIETLAAKFSTTAAILREANHIPPKMRLKAGSTILVPRTALAAEIDIAPELADSATMSIEPDVPDFRRIAVKAGKRDTLASIARRYKVSIAQIKSWNTLQRDTLTNGQALQIQVPYRMAHAKRGHATLARNTHGTHKVHHGRTIVAQTKSHGKGKKRLG